MPKSPFNRILATVQHYGPAFFSLSLLALALWALHMELGELNGGILTAELHALRWPAIFISVALTAASYVLLGVNEAFGLRYAGKTLPWLRSAFVSFVSYSFAQNLGFNLLTGGSIRFGAPVW
jgi:phosphatidylglycerol lysyltransferase